MLSPTGQQDSLAQSPHSPWHLGLRLLLQTGGRQIRHSLSHTLHSHGLIVGEPMVLKERAMHGLPF